VDITIGFQNNARELTIASAESTSNLEASIVAALDAGTGVLSLTDDHGRITMIPTAAIAFVQIGPDTQRRVGFGAVS
jgi:hypothetical protein